MRTIKITKVELAEIEVLQAELLSFITYKSATMNAAKNPSEYCNDLLLMDIASNLYYNFRSRIEKTAKAVATVSLSASEAVTLIQVCSDEKSSIRGEFQTYVMHKFIGILYGECVNLTKY